MRALGSFIFAGGFTVGVKKHFDVVAHFEGNDYGVSTARLNFPDLPIFYGSEKWPHADYRDRVDFVYCNPPCAPFSAAGIRTTRGGADAWRADPRVGCWLDAFSLIEKLRPRAWASESVTQIYTAGRDLIDDLTRKALLQGYSVSHVLIDAKWMGVPQSRKRFFLVAHRPVKLQGYQLNWSPPTTVGEVLATVKVPGQHAPVRPAFMPALLAAKPGQGLSPIWEQQNPGWSENRNHLGKVIGRPSFSDARVPLDKPMGAFIGNKFYHPTEHRMLGIEEQKAICGYPPDFVLDGPIGGQASLLARAVLPPVGEWLARAIAATLEQPDGTWADRTVTLYDFRAPEIAPVDLTRTYLNERGLVKIPFRAAAPTVPSAPVAAIADVLGVDPAEIDAADVEEEPIEAPPVAARPAPVVPAPRPTPPPLPALRSLQEGDPVPLTGEGSGKFIQRLLLTGAYTPETIAGMVLANYPNRKTRVSDVYFNYRILLDAKTPGLPPWRGGVRESRIVSRDPPPARSPTPSRAESAPTTSRPEPGEPPPETEYNLVPFIAAKRIKRALLYFPNLAEPGREDPISSARIAWYLRDRIHFDAVYDQRNRPTEIPGQIDELWVVNSSWVYMDHEWRIDSTRLFPVADKVIFCSNDYMMVLHGYHAGRIREDALYVNLSTVEKKLEVSPGALVNWNVLTYNPLPIDPFDERSGLYYYGSFRAGRRAAFDRLLEKFGDQLEVSPSNVRSMTKFRETYPSVMIVPRAPNVIEELKKKQATLVLEDDFSSTNFVSPPNRFYEALSAPCAMLFEESSIEMFDRYGYDVRPYVFRTPEEAMDLAERDPAIRVEQAESWRRDYVGELDEQLQRAIAHIEMETIGRRGPPPNQKRYSTHLNYEGELPRTGIKLNTPIEEKTVEAA